MIAKLPIISSSATLQDIAIATQRLFDDRAKTEFSDEITKYTSTKCTMVMNSGIAAYYLVLCALKRRYNKTEVVLPAYTAGSLIIAVRKAGLKPVLCDISLADFNAGVNEMAGAITSQTLAVTCVHMFGLGIEGVERIRAAMPPATVLIEDCAQSMGSRVNGRLTGTFGDIAFFSFNRGKNLPVSGGGAIITNSELLAGSLRGIAGASFEMRGKIGFAAATRSLAYLAATNGNVYGALYPFISKFKESAPPDDISIGSMTNFQAALGTTLIKRHDSLFARRLENGMALMNGLKDMKGLLVPVISQTSAPVFNRFPVVFEEARMRTRAERLLWDRGIESSRMYIRPLHHMFDLRHKESDFPHACYVAQRLLALPVHPAVKKEHIDIMTSAIRDVLAMG